MADGVRLSTKAIEIAGRNWLVSQLLGRGFDVATPEVDQGIDLIIFREIGTAGIRALPLQLKCATGRAFSLDKKYEGRGIPQVYVWNVLADPEAYILDYDEALAVLGDQAASSPSFVQRGYYSVSTISAVRAAGLAPYRNRWDWLSSRLEAQAVTA